MSDLCNLLLQQFKFLYIQPLPNNCSHMEEVHLHFCAHLINIFLFFTGVELRHFFHQKCKGGVRFVQSVIQTYFIPFSHIEYVHLLFYAHFTNIFFFLGVCNSDIVSLEVLRWFLVCVICNLSSFHSFIIKLCIMIAHVHHIIVLI